MVNYFIAFGFYSWYMYYLFLLHDLLLDEISPLVMLSLNTKHDTLDSYNYHDNGNDNRTSCFIT